MTHVHEQNALAALESAMYQLTIALTIHFICFYANMFKLRHRNISNYQYTSQKFLLARFCELLLVAKALCHVHLNVILLVINVPVAILTYYVVNSSGMSRDDNISFQTSSILYSPIQIVKLGHNKASSPIAYSTVHSLTLHCIFRAQYIVQSTIFSPQLKRIYYIPNQSL